KPKRRCCDGAHSESDEPAIGFAPVPMRRPPDIGIVPGWSPRTLRFEISAKQAFEEVRDERRIEIESKDHARDGFMVEAAPRASRLVHRRRSVRRNPVADLRTRSQRGIFLTPYRELRPALADL